MVFAICLQFLFKWSSFDVFIVAETESFRFMSYVVYIQQLQYCSLLCSF